MKKRMGILLLFICFLVAGYIKLSNEQMKNILDEKKLAFIKDKNDDSSKYKKSSSRKKTKDSIAVQSSQVNTQVNTKYIFPAQQPVRATPGKDKYTVKVEVAQQEVNVYKNGARIKSMECSTGIPGDRNTTPLGHFRINGYFGQSFYNSKLKEGARYWVGFINAKYLFHSVPTNQDGKVITSEADKIGNRASHGCIRLSIANSYWFYETIPQGSEVIIE